MGTHSAVRTYRTGLLMIATAGLLAAAPPAHADTQYGGTGNSGPQSVGPPLSLVRHDDGRIVGRLGSGYRCGKRSFVNRSVKLTGSTPDGVSFTATGTTRLSGKGPVRYTLTGTLTPDTVTGTLTEGARAAQLLLPITCAPRARPPERPRSRAATLFAGLTAQSTGGVRLPVALRTTKNGKVLAYWLASMRCGPKAVVPLYNQSPTAAIKPDGTFGRNEAFTVKYSDGSSERFRVSFKGRFLADGAVGTLRARSQLRKKGKRYYPCDSGTQTWAARP